MTGVLPTSLSEQNVVLVFDFIIWTAVACITYQNYFDVFRVLVNVPELNNLKSGY